MAWNTDRKQTLPKDWQSRRLIVLGRDHYSCQWVQPDGTKCGRPANEVDHIGDRLNHDAANLRALCQWHHSRRTSRQGNDARQRVSQRRQPEKHPGIR